MYSQHRYLFFVLAFASVLVVSSMSAQADDVITQYTVNEDGSYTPTARYLGDVDAAIAAYARSSSVQVGGEVPMYSTSEDGTATRIGSVEGFQKFLDDNYTRLGSSRTNQACDNTVGLNLTVGCPGSCPPGTCLDVITADITLKCQDDPPCPIVGKTECAPFADRITGLSFFGNPCACTGPNCGTTGAALDTLFASGPICECEEPPPPDDPYSCVNFDPVDWTSPDPIQPNQSAQITAVLPAFMELSKGAILEAVELKSSTLDLVIGPDNGGVSQFTVTGSGQFESYVFDGEPVGVSDFAVLSGGGTIDWNTREVSAKIGILVTAAGFLDIRATASGVGVLSVDSLSIELSEGGLGIEIGFIPTVSEWGMIVMVLLALTAGTVVFARWRRPAAA